MKTIFFASFLLGLNTFAALTDIPNGVYEITSEDHRCGVLVRTSPEVGRIDFSLVTNPRTLSYCEQNNESILSLTCVGSYCRTSIGTEFTMFNSADYRQIQISSSYSPQGFTIDFVRSDIPKPKMWTASRFWGWSWGYREYSERRCSFKNGASKLCRDITSEDVKMNMEFTLEELIAKFSQEPLKQCHLSGTNNCRVDSVFTDIIIRDSASGEYRSGHKVEIIVRGN